MKKLTEKEQEIMHYFWDNGALFVRDVLEKIPEPKPHYNTVSTVIRVLEEKGFLDHKTYGTTYQYYAKISRETYKSNALKRVISGYFDNSYTNVVSSLIEEEELSVEELKRLIEQIEKNKKK